MWSPARVTPRALGDSVAFAGGRAHSPACLMVSSRVERSCAFAAAEAEQLPTRSRLTACVRACVLALNRSCSCLAALPADRRVDVSVCQTMHVTCSICYAQDAAQHATCNTAYRSAAGEAAHSPPMQRLAARPHALSTASFPLGAGRRCTVPHTRPALPSPALPCPQRAAAGEIRVAPVPTLIGQAWQRRSIGQHSDTTRRRQQTAAPTHLLRAFRHRQSGQPAPVSPSVPSSHCMRLCSWSTCSVSCGGGSAVRTRTIAVHAADGGLPCGATSEAGVCAALWCPVDCVLTAWSAWARCSDHCNGAALHVPDTCARTHRFPRVRAHAHQPRRARRLPALSCGALVTVGLAPQRARRRGCAWSWRRPRSAASLAAGTEWGGHGMAMGNGICPAESCSPDDPAEACTT